MYVPLIPILIGMISVTDRGLILPVKNVHAKCKIYRLEWNESE